MSVVLSFKIRKYYALVVVSLLCLNTAFAQEPYSETNLKIWFDNDFIENSFKFFFENEYFISEDRKHVFFKTYDNEIKAHKFYKYNTYSQRIVGISETIDSLKQEEVYYQILLKLFTTALKKDQNSFWYYKINGNEIEDEISINDCRRIIRNISADSLLNEYPKLKRQVNLWVEDSRIDKENYSVFEYRSKKRHIYIVDNELDNTAHSFIVLNDRFDEIVNPNLKLFNRINLKQYFRNLECSNNLILSVENFIDFYNRGFNLKNQVLNISLLNLDTEETIPIYDGKAFNSISRLSSEPENEAFEEHGFELKSNEKIKSDLEFYTYLRTNNIPLALYFGFLEEIDLENYLLFFTLNCKYYSNSERDVYYFLLNNEFPYLIISKEKNSNYWKVHDAFKSISVIYNETSGVINSVSQIYTSNNQFERNITNYTTKALLKSPFKTNGKEIIQFLFSKDDIESLKGDLTEEGVKYDDIDSLNVHVNLLPNFEVFSENFDMHSDMVNHTLKPLFSVGNEITLQYEDLLIRQNDSIRLKPFKEVNYNESVKLSTIAYSELSPGPGISYDTELPLIFLVLFYHKLNDKKFIDQIDCRYNYESVNNTLNLWVFPNDLTSYNYFNRLNSFIGFSKNHKFSAHVNFDLEEELIYKLDFNDIDDFEPSNSVIIYDYEKGEQIHEYKVKELNSISNFSIDNEILIAPVSLAHNEIIDISDNANPKKIADYYFYNPREWYVVTPEGFYDKSDFAKDNLYYVYNNEEVFNLDQFQKDYQVPGLLDILLGKDKNNSIPTKLSLKEQIKNLPPLIESKIVNDSILYCTIKRRGGGAKNIYFNIAGNDVKLYTPQFDDNNEASFDININSFYKNLNPTTTNTVYVRATNDNNSITSNGPKINYIYQPRSKGELLITKDKEGLSYNPNPKLYALFVGIENYDAPRRLDYAVKDATEMRSYIDLINREWIERYDSTLTYQPYIKILSNDEALKDNIDAELDYIKDNARAQDIVMLFFSGHGITASALKNPDGNNQNFYFITKDFDQYGKNSFTDIDIENDFTSKQAISSSELQEFLKGEEMYAQKKILILDACYSGQFLEDDQGLVAKSNGTDLTSEQIKALQDLNDKSGSVVITASRSNAKAYEADKYKHSFLTWGLIKALKEDYTNDNNLLNISSWLLNTKNIVENQINHSKAQRPSIELNKDIDFQLGLVTKEIQEQITLDEPLPVMNSARINFNDFGDEALSVEITLELNRILESIAEQEDYNKRPFTFRSQQGISDGYRIIGKITSVDNVIKLQYQIKNRNDIIALDLEPCNNNSKSPAYCIELPRKDYNEKLRKFVQELINQLNTKQKNEN